MLPFFKLSISLSNLSNFVELISSIGILITSIRNLFKSLILITPSKSKSAILKASSKLNSIIIFFINKIINQLFLFILKKNIIKFFNIKINL